MNSKLWTLRSCGQGDHVVEEVISWHNISDVVRLSINRLKEPSSHQVDKISKIIKLIAVPLMIVKRGPERWHSDNFDRATHRSVLLLNHLDRPLPALPQRCKILLYENVKGCFGQVFGRLHNVFLRLLELSNVAGVLRIYRRHNKRSLDRDLGELLANGPCFDDMVLDCLVELREVKGNEKVQQDINFSHHLCQLSDMHKSHTPLNPLFTPRPEIWIILELINFGLIRLEFNNIQLVVKIKIIDKLVDEDLTQHGIEPNQAYRLVL